jgi:hypothetical protein
MLNLEEMVGRIEALLSSAAMQFRSFLCGNPSKAARYSKSAGWYQLLKAQIQIRI